MRLLFVSIHCYLDLSSGAAISARQLMELMAERGHACRALTAGVLDYHEERPLERVLETVDVGYAVSEGIERLQKSNVWELEAGGVRITIMPTRSSSAQVPLQSAESADFLELAAQEIRRFRPHFLDLSHTYIQTAP